MARPIKERLLCPRGRGGFFAASGAFPAVDLAADELEALRLNDLEELDQVEAARRMGVSRGTLQRLLYAAHRKVAFALVGNRSLAVSAVSETDRGSCRGSGDCRCRFCEFKWADSAPKKEEMMKIAVCCENNEVFQHFGHTPEFAVFDVVEGRLNGMKLVPTGECGHGALASFLKDLGVEVLLCGGIGGGAQMALAEAGIRLVGGVSGDVVEAVGDYLKGTLSPRADFSCHHHDGEGHSCGGHGQGGGQEEHHSCGGHCGASH